MPLPVLFRSGRRLRARIGALAAVPFAIAATVSAIYYANLHRTAAAMAASSMAAFPGPAPGDRILIVAPHCDDETLGAGGLIETARRRGVPVKVVFLTHGDGFRIAASLALREVSPGPTDYLRFGEHRRSEAIAALTRLGVSPADIHFLGYPDQGLKMVWDTTSSPDTAFRSRFTETTRVPYPSAYRPDAPHTAESIVTDVSQIVADFRPTDVFTTHPSDDH
ncbi:MAG: PIG-L deacetylase family protein, partial [Armatimonadaceae bacterium]